LFQHNTHSPLNDSDSDNELPDLSRYIHSDTFSIPTHKTSHRILIVGDIHGQLDSFQDLLIKLDYDPSPLSDDFLIHVGDLVAKSSVSDTLRVLDWMATKNITGVRGNHDQVVIDWKTWQDWIRKSEEGKLWLDRLDSLWEEANRDRTKPQHPAKWVEMQKDKTWNDDKKWWKKLPKGWKMDMFAEHYLIASAMNQEHYNYLLSLPLILHIPFYHAFVVHAGMLASDPSRPPYSNRQPLAHIPDPPQTQKTHDRSTLRKWQEMAILSDIPQNKDPWVVLNVRGLKKDHSVTKKGKRGTPWSQTWNNMMNRCSGYRRSTVILGEGDVSIAPLPCLPSTVIYGHAAARGLDIKRWSFGLDSGCVYGRRLTALVLESPTGSHTLKLDEDFLGHNDEITYDEDEDEFKASESLSSKRGVRFGDDDEQYADAYLVDVKCR